MSTRPFCTGLPEFRALPSSAACWIAATAASPCCLTASWLLAATAVETWLESLAELTADESAEAVIESMQ